MLGLAEREVQGGEGGTGRRGRYRAAKNNVHDLIAVGIQNSPNVGQVERRNIGLEKELSGSVTWKKEHKE